MDQEIEDRWTEIEFYFIVRDLFKLNNSVMDLHDIIDALSTYGKYNANRMKELAGMFLQDPYYKPGKKELVAICKLKRVPNWTIINNFKLSYRDLVKLNKEEKNNPRMYFNRVSPQLLKEIKAFVDCFNKLRKVGQFYVR